MPVNKMRVFSLMVAALHTQKTNCMYWLIITQPCGQVYVLYTNWLKELACGVQMMKKWYIFFSFLFVLTAVHLFSNRQVSTGSYSYPRWAPPVRTPSQALTSPWPCPSAGRRTRPWPGSKASSPSSPGRWARTPPRTWRKNTGKRSGWSPTDLSASSACR